MCDVHTWKCQRVGKWLKRAGFPQYVQSFTQEHRIDGMALLSLTEMDLRSPPLELKVLGDIKRLMLAIRKLQRENQYHLAINQRLENGTRTLRQRDFFRGDGSDFAESDGFTHSDDSSSENKVYIPTFKPEIWKTVISFLYVFLVFLVTAFVMVIVHDRVPDREKYPPLPDLFLDSVPRIPWAFVMCEITGLVLCTIWCIVLLLHKHRFILMRRMFALTGTVFMLRCLTMLMTSLSVPGEHLECSGKLYGDFWTRLHRAFVIWSGLGMTLTGVHTCGDYMFSGHTVVLTLLNHFITEYTPRNMYTLHISSWVMNLFGIFFILAAHEHYSIDVFIAFYISSRLFLYYHTLANNRVLRHGDKDRTRAWFPLFSFFESEVDGIVPNEYEWPFPIPSIFRENEETENDT